MKRKEAIRAARVAGYHNNVKQLTRLLIESRIARKLVRAAFQRGAAARAAGVPCTCGACIKEAAEHQAMTDEYNDCMAGHAHIWREKEGA